MKLKIIASGSDVYWLHFFNSQKNLVIEWLSWLPNQSSFNNSIILETLKDSHITPLSLMFIKQRKLGAFLLLYCVFLHL